jgi:hypothetical protein
MKALRQPLPPLQEKPLELPVTPSLQPPAPPWCALLLVTGSASPAHLGSGTGLYFDATVLLQLAAIACMLGGRKPAG